MATKATVSLNNYQKPYAYNKLFTLRYNSWLCLIAPFYIAFITFLAYLPSLHYSFQFDDLSNIQKCFSIRHNTLKSLFFTGPRWVSNWLNTLYYKINKFDPFIYRLANVSFHVLASILLFYVLFIAFSRLQKQLFISQHAFFIAFTTALFFALHPVQTQTVSYVIQGQLEGLAGLSIITLVLCFLFYCSSTSKLIKYSSCFTLFIIGILACGTKEIAIVCPFLLLLTDWFLVAQGSFNSFRSRFIFHGAFTITILGIYCYFLKLAFFRDLLGLKMVVYNNSGNVITQHPASTIEPLHFCISQFKVIVHYIGIFLWPGNISVEYDWKLVTGFFAFDCLAPLAFLAFLAYFIFKRLRRSSVDILSFGALWFFIVVLPRSSIMPSSELLVDYKTYIASIGILLIIAILLTHFLIFINRLAKKCLPGYVQADISTFFSFLIISSLLLGFATYKRNHVWSCEEAFWHNIIEKAPGKARAYNNYGAALAEQKKHKQAIIYYKKAINLDTYYSDPLNNLAVAYYSLGKFDKAITTAKKSLILNAYQPETYFNLSNAFLEKKDYKEALEYIEKALQLRPNYGKAHFNKGRVMREMRNYQESYEAFKKCCMHADLDNELGFSFFGDSCMIIEKYDEAITAYKQALVCNPQSALSAFNLANSYFLNKQFEQALPIYKQLTSISKDIKLWLHLGDTYAMLHRYKEALAIYQELEKDNKNIPEIVLGKAGCLERLGMPEEAKLLLIRFISTNPEGYYTSLAKLALKNLNNLSSVMSSKQSKPT